MGERDWAYGSLEIVLLHRIDRCDAFFLFML